MSREQTGTRIHASRRTRAGVRLAAAVVAQWLALPATADVPPTADGPGAGPAIEAPVPDPVPSAGPIGTSDAPAAAATVAPGFEGCRFEGTLAEEFLADGDSFRAITEYRRLLFGCRDPVARDALWLRIGDAFLRARRYEEARKVYGRLAGEGTAGPARPVAKYRLALAFLEAGVAAQASKHLAICSGDADCQGLVGADRLRLAEAVIRFEDRDWAGCRDRLKDFGTRHPASALRDVADFVLEQAIAADGMTRVSPALAGIMSAVVPGLGQVYEKRYADGLQSFLFAGGLGVGAGVLFYHEARSSDPEWVLPSLMAVAAAVFHAANIYGAVNGARMSNMMEDYRIINDARPRYQERLRGP